MEGELNFIFIFLNEFFGNLICFFGIFLISFEFTFKNFNEILIGFLFSHLFNLGFIFIIIWKIEFYFSILLKISSLTSFIIILNSIKSKKKEFYFFKFFLFFLFGNLLKFLISDIF